MAFLIDPKSNLPVPSPTSVDRRRKVADAMMTNARSTAPVQHWSQGAARLVDGLMAGMNTRRAEEEESRGRSEAQRLVMEALSGGAPDTQKLVALAGNEWVNPGQMQVASALWERANTPQERWEPTEMGGMPGQRNTVTGKFDPFPAGNTPDPFTLAPGQTRYNPDGTVIAAIPDAPKPPDAFTLSPGQTRYGPDGKPIAAAPEDPTARKTAKDPNGIERYIDTGEPVFPEIEQQPDGPKLANITSIRKEYESQPGTSRYRTAVPILNSMAASIENPSTMADLDFVYGMAKIFDPESVVRESEMGLVIEGQSLPAQISGTLNKILNGQAALGPQLRRDLVNASMTRVGQYEQQAKSEADYFRGVAERALINPEDIVRPLEALPQLAPLPAPPDPTAAAPGIAPAQPPANAVPTIANDADYDALPPGAEFIDPEGVRRRKP